MKKFIVVLTLCVVLVLPVSVHAQVLMGEAYTTQIEPVEHIEQLRSQLISLIKQLIITLQAQLDAITASQGGQVVQTTTPGQTAVQGSNNEPRNIMEPLNIKVVDTLYVPNDLVITVSDLAAVCQLVVTDERGDVYRDQKTWMKDSDGNGRQVVDLGPTAGRKFKWKVECTKSGFEKFEAEGEVTTA